MMKVFHKEANVSKNQNLFPAIDVRIINRWSRRVELGSVYEITGCFSSL